MLDAALPDRTAADLETALLSRLFDTARLIETMLIAERQRYFDALTLKRGGLLSGNVTAQFFADAAVPGP